MRDREENLTRLDPIAWPHGVQSTVGRESRNRVSFTGSQHNHIDDFVSHSQKLGMVSLELHD